MRISGSGPGWASKLPPQDFDSSASTSDKKTLRDEFAMAALMGFIAADPPMREGEDIRVVAKGCYFIADAMMEARR